MNINTAIAVMEKILYAIEALCGAAITAVGLSHLIVVLSGQFLWCEPLVGASVFWAGLYWLIRMHKYYENKKSEKIAEAEEETAEA